MCTSVHFHSVGSIDSMVLYFQMCDFIENHYLTEQVEAIKELADYVTNLKRVGPGMGEYLFDKHNFNKS